MTRFSDTLDELRVQIKKLDRANSAKGRLLQNGTSIAIGTKNKYSSDYECMNIPEIKEMALFYVDSEIIDIKLEIQRICKLLGSEDEKE